MRELARVGAGLLVLALASAASAEGVALDRTVARFDAPELGGALHPELVHERELAFEARLEALAERDRAPRDAAYAPRHVQAALERHVAEELLAHLPIAPEPSFAEVARRAESAREVLEQRVGGHERLLAAAAAEGIASDELDAILRRQARASLYLDRMVTPVLTPSDAELREAWRTGATPFAREPFDAALPALRRWHVADRLASALTAFFQNARARVHLVVSP